MNYEYWGGYAGDMMNYGYWVLNDKRRLLSSIEKAKKLLGYEPQTGFEEGLKKVHAWCVENWENIERSAEFYVNR